MPEDNRKICFVVMGFGTKTAYTKDHKVRTLDLDATYESIIEPAVSEAGLRCIRADKMLNAGMIDTRMYEMLLRADLVIADISTGNVNAVYELGVRHALRPHATILMQEEDAAFHFDLAHVSTFTYQHMGEDIGNREALRKKAALRQLIESVMNPPTRDSPVYEYLRELEPPALPKDAYDNLLTVIEEQGDRLAEFIRNGKRAMKSDDFERAIKHFGLAYKVMTGDSAEVDTSAGLSELDFVVQQLALATYKGGQPSKKAALEEGLRIIEQLNPDTSHDVETLGIAGAIHKRLWDQDQDRVHLDKAIEYYSQGFHLQKDYYNGENYASCLDVRAAIQVDKDDSVYDAMTATKVRKEVVHLLESEFESTAYEDRSDKLWMNATMANSLFAMGRNEDATTYEKRFKELASAKWQLETYEQGKAQVLKTLDKPQDQSH